jgi:hypothetical protein
MTFASNDHAGAPAVGARLRRIVDHATVAGAVGTEERETDNAGSPDPCVGQPARRPLTREPRVIGTMAES